MAGPTLTLSIRETHGKDNCHFSAAYCRRPLLVLGNPPLCGSQGEGEAILQ